MPKPTPRALPHTKPVYSVKGQDLVNELDRVFDAALVAAKDKDHRYAIFFWYREQKALALLSSGDLKPKQKCKHCRERGKYLQAAPNKGGPYKPEDFSYNACPCIVGQVLHLTEPQVEEIYKKALKAKEDAEAKLNAGTGAEPEPKVAKPKRGTSKSKPETQGEAEPQTPVKRRVKKDAEPEPKGEESRKGTPTVPSKAKKTKNPAKPGN